MAAAPPSMPKLDIDDKIKWIITKYEHKNIKSIEVSLCFVKPSPQVFIAKAKVR